MHADFSFDSFFVAWSRSINSNDRNDVPGYLLFLERALKNCTSFPGILCAITLYFKSFWDL